MPIRVLSFDFDGCLFHSKYIHADPENKDVIEQNKFFFEKIKENNADYEQCITFVGSNRQSKKIDDHNSPLKGSCFPALIKITEHLGAEMDPFLLADVYGDLEAGTAFKRAIEEKDARNHPEWVFDESKVSILYAQMHKTAEKYPTSPIVFEFFDDRDDVLLGLDIFYTDNPELIPPNLTLKTYYYKGGELVLTKEMSGNEKSYIDTHYRDTVKKMATQNDADNDYDNQYKFIHFIDAESLRERPATEPTLEAESSTMTPPSSDSETDFDTDPFASMRTQRFFFFPSSSKPKDYSSAEAALLSGKRISLGDF